MMQLISDNYKALNAGKHSTSTTYGTSGAKHIGYVSDIMKKYDIQSAIDYGCGKATLRNILPIELSDKMINYDPCIEEYSIRPFEPAELVTCTDVMEHVEPEFIDNVLSDIQNLSTRYVYFNISTVESRKHLPDGRNAHLNVYPDKWWINKLRNYFELVDGDYNLVEVNIIGRKSGIRVC